MYTFSCTICGVSFLSNRKHRVACKEKTCRIKAQNKIRSDKKKEWNKNNQPALIKSKQKWLLNNPEKRAESSASYMTRNKAYYNSYSSSRRSRVISAQPRWQNPEELLDVYKEAQYMQLEVDHIIPIKHPLVCGLHVVGNLQLLSRTENAKKSNKFNILDEDILVILGEDNE